MGIDGRTDMMKLIVTFRNVAKAPKNLKGGRGTVRRNGNEVIDKIKLGNFRSYVCVIGCAYSTAACLDTDDFTRLPTAHTRIRILLDLLLRHHMEFQCKIIDLNIYLQVISVHACAINSTKKKNKLFPMNLIQ